MDFNISLKIKGNLHNPLKNKSAVKFIAKLEKNTQERIVTALKGLLSIPPEGDIKSCFKFIKLVSKCQMMFK